MNRHLAFLWQLRRFSNPLEIACAHYLRRQQERYRVGSLEILATRGDAVAEPIGADIYRDPLIAMRLNPATPLRVADFGANVGAFTLLLAIMGLSLEKGLAVEMNPATAARLERNLGANLPAKVSVWRGALTDFSGDLSLSFGGGNSGESLIRGGDPSGSLQRVKCDTFDALIALHFGDAEIDLCKIDVEGAEYEILTGMHCRRLSQCRNLLVEFHDVGEKPGRDRAAVIARLDASGLRPDASVGLRRFGVHRFARP